MENLFRNLFNLSEGAKRKMNFDVTEMRKEWPISAYLMWPTSDEMDFSHFDRAVKLIREISVTVEATATDVFYY